MADDTYISIENTFTYQFISLYSYITQLLNNAHNIPNDYTSTLIKGKKIFADC